MAIEVGRLLHLERVGADPRASKCRCTLDTLSGVVTCLTLRACTADSAAPVVAALLALTLRFAHLFHTLEFIVAVASFGTRLTAGTATSVVTTLLSFAAWFTTLVRKDVRTLGADVVAAVTEEEAEVVALAVVSCIEGAA